MEPAVSEVAILGRSNVGKSSFLNALCQREGLAKVSQTPGRTRTINIFAAEHLRWIVDLPGYGYAAGPAEAREGWAAMIEGYLLSRRTLRGIYLLIDSKVGATKLDHQMRHWFKTQNLAHRIVGNKIDQIKPSQRAGQQKAIAHDLRLQIQEIAWISATEGAGMPLLRQEISHLLQF